MAHLSEYRTVLVLSARELRASVKEIAARATKQQLRQPQPCMPGDGQRVGWNTMHWKIPLPLLLTILATAALGDLAQGFSPGLPATRAVTDSKTILLLSPSESPKGSSDDEQPPNENEVDSEEDSLFVESLRQAANSKLGSPIPASEFAEKSANQAENDFLQAMQDAREEMAKAKEESGGNVDDAIQKVLGKIQKEEQMLEKIEKEWNQNDKENLDEDPSASFQ